MAAGRVSCRHLEADAAPLDDAQDLLALGGKPATVEVARVTPSNLEFRRLGAAVERVRTAGTEMASGGERDQRRRLALDLGQAVHAFPVRPRDGAEQAPGVGVLRLVEDLVEGAGL